MALVTNRDLARRALIDQIASIGLTPVVHIAAEHATLTARRSGEIVVHGGYLRAIYGRWWPHVGSRWRAGWDQWFRHSAADCCHLFYHVPWNAPQFLTVSYIYSHASTSVASVYAATLVLDEIARLKRSQAIVCNVANNRISDRAMARWGWESHCKHWIGRHFIKRFYGKYPKIPACWRSRLCI